MNNRRQWRRGMLGVLVVVLLLSGLSFPAAPPLQAQTQVTYLYFPQTGHYLGGAFRSFWERNGGVDTFGYPVTEEYIRRSDERVVQYFERGRFELQVFDNQAVVDLGLIGRDFVALRGDIFPTVAPFPSTSARRYFPETQHSLQGAFKAYWERNGGVGIFGFPISEEVAERFPDGVIRTVQYFERGRLELHGNRVLVGLLGTALAPCELKAPVPANAPPSAPAVERDSSPCPEAVPAAVGRAFPFVSQPGTVLGFEASGYAAGETVSLWLNRPDGTIRELPYRGIAADDGVLLIGFRTEANDPTGQWSIVGRGLRSGREVVALFVLQ